MKRTYTTQELSEINDHMMNYTVQVKVYGCETSFKVHCGLKGNHLDIINKLAIDQFGPKAKVLGAKVNGQVWQEVSPF